MNRQNDIINEVGEMEKALVEEDQQAWQRFREILRKKTNSNVFAAFFESLESLGFADGLLQIGAPNTFHHN